MKECLLVVDIGNSSIKTGLSCRGILQKIWTFPARISLDEEAFKKLLKEIAEFCRPKKISHILACSVVPEIDSALGYMLGGFFGLRVLFAGKDLHAPLVNKYENPAALGQDRIVAAYGARQLFPEPASLIVVDCGTAVTLDCVKGNEFLGGLIFPGMITAAKALGEKASRLPDAALENDGLPPLPCTNTEDCLRAGILLGYAALAEGLCGRLENCLPKPVEIVATGGYAPLLAKNCKIFHNLVSDLVLRGLIFLASRHNLANRPARA